MLTALVLLLCSATPNSWDKAALTFDVIGVVGVAPTIIVGTISEFYPAWKPVKNATAAITVGSIATGWTLQGVAAWSHLPEPRGDNWIDKHTPLHAFGSAAAVGGIYALGRSCRLSKRDALIAGVTGSTIASLGVECWQQWSGRGRLSWKDITIDIIALTISSIIILRALP